MLAHLSTAVVVLDPDLNTLTLNPAAETLFSLSARMVVGRSVTAWLPGAVDFQDRFTASQEDGQAWTGRELPLVLAGGMHPITVDLTVTPVEDGRLILEFTGLDRHLRISREDQLVAQQQATRSLVRGLAHEIKNPLGGIRGAAQLLERKLDNAGLREYTRVIVRESDRLASMVDALLGPSRAPRREPVNIHEVIENVLALIETEFPDRPTVRREYDPSLPEVLGDAGLLTQALLNIARNAVQASSRDKDIIVRTRIERQVTLGGRRHRHAVCVDVIDHGEGVPPELQDRIFFPLVSSRADGSGLGLSIAQGLVARHGGLVECESEPGRTVFTTTLPLENDDG